MGALHVQATASETGQSPYAVSIAMGPHVLTGDESETVGGAGLGPSPFELLAAALAECTVMTMRWYANQQGWAVETLEVTVDYGKRQPAGATLPVDTFEKTIVIRGVDLTDEQRTRLLNVAAKCPVQRTLEAIPTITTVVGLPVQPAAG